MSTNRNRNHNPKNCKFPSGPKNLNKKRKKLAMQMTSYLKSKQQNRATLKHQKSSDMKYKYKRDFDHFGYGRKGYYRNTT